MREYTAEATIKFSTIVNDKDGYHAEDVAVEWFDRLTDRFNSDYVTFTKGADVEHKPCEQGFVVEATYYATLTFTAYTDDDADNTADQLLDIDLPEAVKMHCCIESWERGQESWAV